MNLMSLHHVTAIASDPQRNLDFYVGLLGMRLVKRTINFDDPGSYHFYFGDATGSPGTILTFFPWPNARPGSRGSGEVESTAFSIPRDSIGYWRERLLAHHVTIESTTSRFDEEVIRLTDPDGMLIELTASSPNDWVPPWNESTVPAEHALRGLHSVSAALNDTLPTARLLTDVFGYRLKQSSGDRQRFIAANANTPGALIDLIHAPELARGRSAAGSVHHVAFRVEDEATQLAWRNRLNGLGYQVSPVMDRTYFKSIYFREPGGILFEIATDAPGFSVDESRDELGQNLKLPSWMERSRHQIETGLPAILLPTLNAV